MCQKIEGDEFHFGCFVFVGINVYYVFGEAIFFRRLVKSSLTKNRVNCFHLVKWAINHGKVCRKV